MNSPNHLTVQTSTYTLWCDPRISLSLALAIAEAPEWLIRTNAAWPVKISRESIIVAAPLQIGERGIRVAHKQFRPHGIWKTFAAAFRPSKARQCWQRAQVLQARGIATPQAIVACWPRLPHIGCGSFLATEWIEGSENLHLFAWRIGSLPSSTRLRRAAQCARHLGQMIGRMHAAGIGHRDLKPANLLVVENTFDMATYVVDLDGVQILGRLGVSRRVRDLARLAAGITAHRWITPAICLRFLRAYCAEFQDEAVDWRATWQAVQAAANEIVRRKNIQGKEVL